MKKQIKYIAIALILLSTLTLLPRTVRAQGTAFAYNGQLNVNGSPANGSYDLSFTLYNAVTNGIVFGSLTNTATGVTDGLFIVILDFGGVFNGSNYWLQIAVRTNGNGAFATLSPLQPILPTPYAVYSANAGKAATATTATTATSAVTAGVAGSANSVSAANIVGTMQVQQLPSGIVMNNQKNVTLGGTFSGSGAGLTNVAMLNGNQTFTGINVFTNYFVIGTPPPFTRNVQVRPVPNRILGIYAANGGGGSVSSGMTIESVNDANSANQPLEFRGSPNVFTTGNVGIFKINPATALDVNGTVAATSFSGNGAGLTNLNLIGPSAISALGNAANGYLDLASNTTGYNNTVMGYEALLNNTTGWANEAYGYWALQNNTSGYQNAAFGDWALIDNTTGYRNTAVGSGALQLNVVGAANTAIGYHALYANTNGNNNTAIGISALQDNTTGYYNTAVGQGSLQSNTNGYNNVADGAGALQNNTSGFNNTANGASALYGNTMGSGNVGNGTFALGNNAIGYNNTASGAYALNANTSGWANTANGYSALVSNTTGYQNAACGGDFTLQFNTVGDQNTASGSGAMQDNTIGSQDTAAGFHALFNSTNGNANVADGYQALYNVVNGSYNIADGFQAGYNITTGSSNIDIGNMGMATDTNIIRIGASQSQTFIAGAISGNGGGLTNLNAVNLMGSVPNLSVGNVTVSSNIYLSTSTSTAGNIYSGSTTLIVSSSSLGNFFAGLGAGNLNTSGSQNTGIGEEALANDTGWWNTAIGYGVLSANTTGQYNTAGGFWSMNYNTTGNNNTAFGHDTLQHNTSASENTAVGDVALQHNVTGSDNVACGEFTLTANINGSYNTAIGPYALRNNLTGSTNIALGYQAGYNVTTGANNIEIGNIGTTNDNNTLNIGTQGVQTNTSIAGIFGATAASGMPVYVTSTGQLGTLTSSAQFKTDIQDMGDASDAVLSLRPVTFKYRPGIDPQGIPQFGLVAEDVEKLDPALVVHDEKGKIYTVRYEAVNAMLLNEFLKEHKKVQEQEVEIENLKEKADKIDLMERRLNNLEQMLEPATTKN